MRTSVCLCSALCMVSLAQAAPHGLGSFKLVNERPAVHATNILHKRINPLRDAVTACGEPIKAGPQRYPTMKLQVAADGSVTDVEIKHTNLSDDTVACIRNVVARVVYPPRKQASVVTFVLVYNF